MEALKAAALSALVHALPLVLTALMGLIAAALVALTKKLNAEASHSKLATLGLRVTSLVDAVVRDVEATVRPLIVAAGADGNLTADEGKAIKDAALRRVKSSLGEHGLKELSAAFGDVGHFLSGLIEASVTRMRTEEAMKSQASALSPSPQ